MATLNWTGAADTLSTNVNNWIDIGTGSPPSSIAAGDTLNFTAGSARDCQLDQTSLGFLTTDVAFVADNRKLIFNQATLQLIHLSLAHGQTIKFTQSSTTITFAGTHTEGAPCFGFPVLYNGNVTYDTGGNAKTTVTYILKNGNSAAAYLTDGELPNVTLDGKFTFNAPHESILGSADPTRDFSESNCCKLSITAAATFVNTPITYSDTQKHIRVTGNGSSSGQHFICAAAICDFSNAKLTIDAKNSQQMPCTNDVTNFGTATDFIALLEDVVVGNFSGNGNKNIIPEGLTLECASLEIQSGSYLYGGGANLQTAAKSHIHVIEKPTIRGTWNFEETTDGIYSSIGGVSSASIHTVKADTVHILGKLTVDGLIDPPGLVLTESAAIADTGHTTAGGKGLLWVKTAIPNNLVFTDDAGNEIALTNAGAATGGGTYHPTTNGLWNDIDAVIDASGVGVNVLVNNWDFTSGTSALDSAMSSGIFTTTSALAGKYLVIAKIQFKPNGLTDGTRNHKLQILGYRNDGGGTPESGTLVNFARHMNANYFGGYILETTFVIDLANTDTFGIYAKIAVSSGSGTWRIAQGADAMTSLTMIKIG